MRRIPFIGCALVAALALAVAFRAPSAEADGRRSWTYPKALEYFRGGGIITLGMWDELHENPVDRASIRNLQLAREVMALRVAEAPPHGVIELLPELRREVLLERASLTVAAGYTDAVLYVYDSPVVVHCSSEGGKEDAGRRLETGAVVRIRGFGVRIVNPSEDRTATVTLEPLRSR